MTNKTVSAKKVQGLKEEQDKFDIWYKQVVESTSKKRKNKTTYSYKMIDDILSDNLTVLRSDKSYAIKMLEIFNVYEIKWSDLSKDSTRLLEGLLKGVEKTDDIMKLYASIGKKDAVVHNKKRPGNR